MTIKTSLFLGAMFITSCLFGQTQNFKFTIVGQGVTPL